MAKSRVERTEEDRERKVQEIKAIALELFAGKGYEGTTIEDIAKALGYGKASLYYYFKNKEEIFTSIVFDTIEGLVSDMDQMCCEDHDAVDDLGSIIDHFLEEKFAKRGLFRVFHQLQIFFSEINQESSREAMIGRLSQIQEKVVKIVVRGQQSGQLKAFAPYRLGELFMGMIFGVVSFTGGPPVLDAEQDNYKAMVRQCILGGILASPATN